jgi:hypothetical protein
MKCINTEFSIFIPVFSPSGKCNHGGRVVPLSPCLCEGQMSNFTMSALSQVRKLPFPEERRNVTFPLSKIN